MVLGVIGILTYFKVISLLARWDIVNRHTVGYLLERGKSAQLVEWIDKGWINDLTNTYSYAPSTRYQSALFAGALLRGRGDVIKALLEHTQTGLSDTQLEIADDRSGKVSRFSPLHLLYLGFEDDVIEQGFHPKGAPANGRPSEAQAWREWIALRSPIQDLLLSKGAVLPAHFEKRGNDSHRELLLRGHAHLLSLATLPCNRASQVRSRL